MRIGAIEAGGTKFVCGIGDETGTIVDSISFPTGHPEQTLNQVISYFEGKQVEAIGVASFGPIDLHRGSPFYGYITNTPKTEWAGFNFLGTLKSRFDLPYGWDTDVNAAALAEAKWGAAKGLDSCVYFTIGTGIGIGIYTEHRRVHGLVHPEGGHMLIRRYSEDTYEGHCPFHADCLEGMASGPALAARWGVEASGLPKDHAGWRYEAHYIGQAVANTIFILSPGKVILGGGVMQQQHLLPLIREEVLRNINGYVRHDSLLANIGGYITSPGLGDQAGLCGALALGLEAMNQ